MTTKRYASKKMQRIVTSTEQKNPVGTKMKKRASKHNLDGTKQTSLITQVFRQIKRDKYGTI